MKIAFSGFIGIVFLYFYSFACCADDISDDNAPQAMTGELSISEIIDRTEKRFADTKATGTVWLRTQQRMNELSSLAKSSNGEDHKARVLELADQIGSDCDLIDNQIALERARYLLSTLDKEALDQDSRKAVLSMLQAADGQGALLLVQGLVARFGNGNN